MSNISQQKKKSIENYKRINTMGQFEIQKDDLDNSMDNLQPKKKKKQNKKIPLPQ